MKELHCLKSKRSYALESYYFSTFIIDTAMKLNRSAAYMFYRSLKLPRISITVLPMGSTAKIKSTNYSLSLDIFFLIFRKYPKDKIFFYFNKFLIKNAVKGSFDYRNLKIYFNKKFYIYNFFYFLLHYYIPRLVNLTYEYSMDRMFNCSVIFPNYSSYDVSNYYPDGSYSSIMRPLGLFSYINRSNICLKLHLDYSILENYVLLRSSELRSYMTDLEIILSDQTYDKQLFRFQKSFFKIFVLNESEESANFA